MSHTTEFIKKLSEHPDWKLGEVQQFSDAPGENGIGMQNKYFRFVVYGPDSVNPVNHKKGDHSPAHLHVMPKGKKKSKIESCFTLIESEQGATAILRDEDRRHLQTKGIRPLPPEDMSIVQPLVDQHAAEFIQLWRELYIDNTALSGAVIRRDSTDPKEKNRQKGMIESTRRPDGFYYTTPPDKNDRHR